MSIINYSLKSLKVENTDNLSKIKNKTKNEETFESIFKNYLINDDEYIHSSIFYKIINSSLNINQLKISKDIYNLSSIHYKFLKNYQETKPIRIIRFFFNNQDKLLSLNNNELIELCNMMDLLNEKNIMKDTLINPLNKILMRKVHEELKKPPAICNISLFLVFMKSEVLMPLKIKYLQNRCLLMQIYVKKNPNIFFEILKNELINFSRIFHINISNKMSTDLILFKEHFLLFFMSKNILKLIKNNNINIFKNTSHKEESVFHITIILLLEDIGYQDGEIIKKYIIHL